MSTNPTPSPTRLVSAEESAAELIYPRGEIDEDVRQLIQKLRDVSQVLRPVANVGKNELRSRVPAQQVVPPLQ